MIAYILPSPKEIDLNVALIFILACFDCSAGDATAQDRKPDRHTYPQKLQDFDPDNFDAPTEINNQTLPIKPGTRLVYEGTTIEREKEASLPCGQILIHSISPNQRRFANDALDRWVKPQASTRHSAVAVGLIVFGFATPGLCSKVLVFVKGVNFQ